MQSNKSARTRSNRINVKMGILLLYSMSFVLVLQKWQQVIGKNIYIQRSFLYSCLHLHKNSNLLPPQTFKKIQKFRHTKTNILSKTRPCNLHHKPSSALDDSSGAAASRNHASCCCSTRELFFPGLLLSKSSWNRIPSVNAVSKDSIVRRLYARATE